MIVGVVQFVLVGYLEVVSGMVVDVDDHDDVGVQPFDLNSPSHH